MSRDDLASHAAALLGGRLAASRRLHGGDLSEVLEIRLGDGRRAVVKGGPGPPVEARMLEAIAATGAPCPPVLAVDDRALVLGVLPGGGQPGPAAWRRLGTALRRLHGETGDSYGWEDDYAFGPVAIPNAPMTDWPGFWAERRLLQGLDSLPAPLARRVERLAAGLGERLPARPPAALLHGDLWAGNLLFSPEGNAALIDPACYRGDGEVDLAMLGMFGRPDPAVFEGYGPLAPGAEERRPVYRLWPALVHLRLFGRGFAGMVEGLLAEAGA